MFNNNIEIKFKISNINDYFYIYIIYQIMKSIKNFILEKLVISKNSNNNNTEKILDVKIKDLEHLKDVLTLYFESIGRYTIKSSRILPKNLIWEPVEHSTLRVFCDINRCVVGNHFKIDMYHNNRIVQQLNVAEYGSIYLIQQKWSAPLRRSLIPNDIIGFAVKHSRSPKDPLCPGRNLLEWINDLKDIKISTGDRPHENAELLRLFELEK